MRYWLRSPYMAWAYYAYSVDAVGEYSSYMNVSTPYGVRPAFKI